MNNRFIALAGGLGVQTLDPRPEIDWPEPKPPKSARVRMVLVTGGAGYIGSQLVRDLLADGCKVRVLDSLKFGDDSIRALYTNPDFEFIRGDIRQVEPVVRAVGGVDAVIHLASLTGVSECQADPNTALETNVAGASLLTDVCRASRVARLLLASTCEVYGSLDRVVDETSEPCPESLYAANQLDAEGIVLAAANDSLKTAAFRLGSVFGVSNRPYFETGVNRLVARSYASKRISLSRDFGAPALIHIEDACRAFRQALMAPVQVIDRQIFNLGSDDPRSDWTSAIGFLLRGEASIDSTLAPIIEAPGGPLVSCAKLFSKLGVKARVSLERGVGEVLAELRRGVTAPPIVLDPVERVKPAVTLASARFLSDSRASSPATISEPERRLALTGS